MDVFVLVGIVGAVLVVASLVLGDALDGLLNAVDLGGGLVTTPVIGGFLAAFGFGAALTRDALGTPFAALVGALAGVAFGGAAGLLTRALLRMRTDPTPRAADLVGRIGVVLTPVPVNGYGQVRVQAHGQRLQLSARADEALPVGAQVVVVEVASPTAVVVTPSGLTKGIAS